jgi:hypothetical protein
MSDRFFGEDYSRFSALSHVAICMSDLPVGITPASMQSMIFTRSMYGSIVLEWFNGRPDTRIIRATILPSATVDDLGHLVSFVETHDVSWWWDVTPESLEDTAVDPQYDVTNDVSPPAVNTESLRVPLHVLELPEWEITVS